MEKGFGDIKIMCVISCGLTKDYGVITADSALWNPNDKSISFDVPKLIKAGNRHLVTYVGSQLFFTNLDIEKLKMPFDSLSVYLSEYLREINRSVQETFNGLVKEEKERPAKLCLFLLGVHGGKPVLAQFNSFLDFKPQFLWSEDGPKFATIYYGEDDPEKSEIFKKSTTFMEEKAKEYKDKLSPGLMGEILVRGSYYKADLEEQVGDKIKYAGGVVSVARIHSDGRICPMSNVINI